MNEINKRKIKIAVVGLGYVGLANVLLFAKNCEVCALDLDPERVAQLNNGKATVSDPDFVGNYADRSHNITATTDPAEAYHNADYVVVATPTNYDEETQYFDTTSVESVILNVRASNPDCSIVIRSTVPIGFTSEMREKTGFDRILMCPEFLREGKAIYDCLHPDRLVIGGSALAAKAFGEMFLTCCYSVKTPVLITNSSEAESIKLFANTFLALRIAFFNEIDSFAMQNSLNTSEIIAGVCADHRVGDFYNNPSFGYGGYCLPKDTLQLLANYGNTPQELITASIASNKTRKDFLTNAILALNPGTVGIYRVVMKSSSDNFRQAAVFDIIDRLISEGIEVLIFEPLLEVSIFEDVAIETDLCAFKDKCDVVVANRLSEEISDIAHKVFSRDIYMRD